jgi:hypothetical protein
LKEKIPQIIPGWISCNGNVIFLNRVDKTYLPGMKRDSSIFIASGKSILKISLNGGTNFGELTPDLVVPPRFRPDL